MTENFHVEELVTGHDLDLLAQSFNLMGDPREMTPFFGQGLRESGYFAEIF